MEELISNLTREYGTTYFFTIEQMLEFFAEEIGYDTPLSEKFYQYFEEAINREHKKTMVLINAPLHGDRTLINKRD